MSERDNKLEQMLNAMEESIPIEQVMDGDNDTDEMESLANLVVSIKELPHPEMDHQTVQSEKERIVSAARDKKRAKQRTKDSKVSGLTGQWLFVPALAGLALILLMAFVLSAGAAIYFVGPPGAHYATLTDAVGQLEVSDTGVSDDWQLVSEGDRVRDGQRIRTGADSRVTLEFFDGTRATLAPNTDIMVENIDGGWGNVLQVELIQNGGETNHQVVPFNSEAAAYQVYTPSGSASVRGTSFTVLVEETGNSIFMVDTGQVLVNNDGTEAYVDAGQGVLTELGKPISATTYLFVLQGVLEDKDGKRWVVDGVPFTVRGGAKIDGNLKVGELVLVEGHIQKHNEWIADSIQYALTEESISAFTGVVNDIDGNVWTVNGFELLYEGVPPSVEIGDMVRVTFKVAEDGTLVATSIIPLDGDEAAPDPEPDPEEDDPLELFFDPDEFKENACESIPAVTGILWNETDESALDVVLESEILDGMDYVEAVAIDPISFVEIAAGDSEDFEVTITLKGGAGSLPPEGEVKVRVSIAGEDESDYLTVKWECEEEEQPEDEPEEDDDGDKCTGTKEHPKALKLVEEYTVDYATYDQIMDWFCNDRLGFGEIELAFKLFDEYPEANWSITQIIAYRLEGKGWGQVKHELAKEAGSALEDGEPAKKEPPGKSKSEENKNKDKPKKKNDD